MPIYEYRCEGCGVKTSLLVRHISETAAPACSHCGERMVRCLSSFAYHKSEATRLEESGNPDQAGPDYYSDPRNIGRWAENKFKDMGMEMPAELKEKIAATRDGVIPDPLKDL